MPELLPSEDTLVPSVSMVVSLLCAPHYSHAHPDPHSNPARQGL